MQHCGWWVCRQGVKDEKTLHVSWSGRSIRSKIKYPCTKDQHTYEYLLREFSLPMAKDILDLNLFDQSMAEVKIYHFTFFSI